MKKILALFPGALGDFICFLPALQNLARERRVDLLARSEYAALAPAAVYAGSIERREISRLFAPGADRDEALRRFFAPYESIYTWTGSGDPNFVRHLELLAGGRAGIFPFRPGNPRLHISDYFLECATGARPGEALPTVSLRPDALLWSRDWLQEHGFGGKKILALAPGSGAKEKNWPGAFYRAVEQWWESERGGRGLVFFGPAEEERSENGCDWGGAAMARNLGLAQIAALLSLCDVYVGNDSGLTHLAAALGVETVALFGPTDPGQWAPRGKRVTVVSRNVECSPCAHQVMKTCPHRKCLTALDTQQIVELLQQLQA